MSTQIAATFVNGVFKPDQLPALPEETRVNLTIDVMNDDENIEDDEDEPFDPERAKAAWEELQARLKERPIHGGGKRFNRDELYERR